MIKGEWFLMFNGQSSSMTIKLEENCFILSKEAHYDSITTLASFDIYDDYSKSPSRNMFKVGFVI